jgi:hypothetical protein
MLPEKLRVRGSGIYLGIWDSEIDWRFSTTREVLARLLFGLAFHRSGQGCGAR